MIPTLTFSSPFTVYQLIVSDLDGTLLDGNHSVDAYTAQTLQSLDNLGVHLAIATGRHFLDVTGIRASLGVRAHLITSNGARIHDPDDQPIHRSDIPPALVRQLTDPALSRGCLLNFYLDDAWLIDQPCQWILDMHQDSGFQYQVSDLTRHSGEGVAKVLYIAEHAHLLEVEQQLHARFGDVASITFSADDCLEVMAPDVSKGNALKLILNRLGVDAADCLAFGDGQNDIELLQVAGHPRIMGNAHPRLATQLPSAQRIGHHRDAAVARHLRELFKLR
ncbi:Cof-type HAD-IIB family hydrolase [Paludibacterium purpuratum]|uniref:Cof subfamily protein (Haloacid dehalogenase superfamily)/HAD superfamily hydrolase (TIGR01484 family) n=1 Tax=Paludibacterium purpuratum TaxID=1144873 RepID=A0A4R7B4W2_9NEIS|nr:Cof-type HAD-IIB family hydrolase [Paludibacterium purpuratum]TDR79684.1 hypothetical protein DFP86_10748 [Paludibacterium purpuratum]